MREIVLDTETTGLEPEAGHRIIELACVELSFRRPTGHYFHRYINPKRDISQDAENIHGLTQAFLSDKPIFEEIVDEWLLFIKSSPLIIHNAAFDKRFLDTEMKRIDMESRIPPNTIIDTLEYARKQYPHSANNLNALCKRFNIDTSQRDKHGALLDASLLAEVYLYLTGGPAPELQFERTDAGSPCRNNPSPINHGNRTARWIELKAEDLDRHQDLVKRLSNPIWNQL